MIGLLCLWPIGAMAQAADWWQGIWAYDPAWCVNADKVGRATPAPIEITGSALLGYENRCTIRRAEDIGQIGAVLLELDCESEGSRYREDQLWMRQDADTAWQWVGFAEPERFTRCKETGE